VAALTRGALQERPRRVEDRQARVVRVLDEELVAGDPEHPVAELPRAVALATDVAQPRPVGRIRLDDARLGHQPIDRPALTRHQCAWAPHFALAPLLGDDLALEHQLPARGVGPRSGPGV